MPDKLKMLYWQTRERLPRLAAGLRRDLPHRRVWRMLLAYSGRQIAIAGVNVQLSPALGGEVIAYLLSGKYEEPERRMFEYALSAGDRVLELGTGIGYLSACCAKRLGNEAVFTFEANPALEPIIRKNYALNQVEPQLEICMLGDRDGAMDFFVTKNIWGSSTVRPRAASKKISVPVKPLDQALERIRPNFLVIDIEGGEHELVRHLKLDGVNKICIELHPYKIGARAVAEVVESIIDQGFVEIAAVSDDEHKLFYRRACADARQ